MKWLVEEYDDHVKDLVTEIRRQGHECDFVKYYDMIQDPNYTGTGLPKGKGEFKEDECVLFYGSIQLAGWLNRHKNWIPTVWYNYDKYKVSHWSTAFGDYMLNNDFIMLPVAEITRRGESIFRSLPGGYEYEDIFIRPDSGTKAFGGKVFSLESFNKDWSNATHLMNPWDICIVSTPYGIEKEWRFFASNGKILTGSQYKINGSAEIDQDYELGAIILAEKLAQLHYDPDPIYTIDIGRSGGDYHLIEINNFCCSGLYAADLNILVSKASELAIKEHAEFYPETHPLPTC